jgi:hypothetical protein
MKMRTMVSRIKQFTAAAVIALAMLTAFGGARPALAGVAAGESAFKNGDFLTAARELQGPAYRGDPLAQYYLGVIYADGLGGDQSPEDGLAWLMCVQTGVGLPPALQQDAKQRRRRLMSRLTPYAMEQAEMRAATLCGRRTAAPKPQPFTTDDDFQDIRPPRGIFGMLFFFPGDTIVFGATIVFHEMGFMLMRNVVMGIIRVMGDLIFGLLSLICWIIICKIVFLFFVHPLANALSARKPSSLSGPMSSPAENQESNSS